MPKVPDIEFCDIVIAKEQTSGYDYERCKMGLWSIYNVIKKIIFSDSNDKNDTHKKILECLYMIGANAKFGDSDLVILPKFP